MPLPHSFRICAEFRIRVLRRIIPQHRTVVYFDVARAGNRAMAKETYSHRMDAKVRKALEKAAKDDGRTASALLERIAAEWLKAKGYLKKAT